MRGHERHGKARRQRLRNRTWTLQAEIGTLGWRNGEFVLVASQVFLQEVIEKFDERGIDQALTTELVAFVLADAEIVVMSATEIPTIIVGDADDDQVLACAIAGQAIDRP